MCLGKWLSILIRLDTFNVKAISLEFKLGVLEFVGQPELFYFRFLGILCSTNFQ